MLKVITTRSDADEVPTIGTTLDDLARDGARRMIAVALQLQAAEYVTRFREARDDYGHALVVRNGTARPRPVTTGVGPDHRRSPDQRPADARRGPAEVHERDPAALRAAVAARGERPAAALPARAVVGGLPRGVARPPRPRGRRLVVERHSAADEELDRGVRGVPAARPDRARLHLSLGRRRALHHPPGGGAARHAGG